MAVLEEKPGAGTEEREATADTTAVCAEDLRRLSSDELMRLYRSGSAPGSVRAVEGHPAGLGIALIVLSGGRIDRRLRRYSRSERFPWHGKSFTALSDEEGWGWNRLAVGPLPGVCPFRISVGPSKTDGAPALVLDYNVPRNPWWQRRTWDELREVLPGVFLGIVGLRLRGGYRCLALFAVDTTRQTPLQGI